jgi:perosamine synthetase
LAQQFETALIPSHANLRTALKSIDNSGLGVALIVDENRTLLGLVTDGDLRRAILDGRGLESLVRQVMNPDPITAREGTPEEQIFGMMNYKIRHVPVVDGAKRVRDLVCFGDVSKKIPWALPYIGKEEEDEVTDSIRSSWVTMGPKVKKLEHEVAEYVGVKHGVAVSNGTAALDVALKILGIAPGDEVIVPAFTYIATANAVLYQHATPVLADIEPRTFNIDPNDVIKRITPRTKCIISIDYGGQSADYDALTEISEKYGLYLVQDGAESLGGEYKGRKLCSFGAISTVSFHAAKVITSVEGGMVLTDDDELADRARIVRNQGEDPVKKYYHTMLGHNYRMTDIHAAIGLAQFSRLDDVLLKRSEIANYYTEELRELEGAVALPYVDPENKHAWFFYPILVENREGIAEYMKAKGIDTRIAWPLPIHMQPVYKAMLGEVRYPVAEQIASTVLNLPLYYKMTEEEMKYVIIHLKDAITQARA